MEGAEGFFFFQGEDGLRNGTVTGVQTCALPISGPPREPPPIGRVVTSPAASTPGNARSEERGVGKECRSRWSAYHQKKKKKTRTSRRRSRSRAPVLARLWCAMPTA